MNNNINYQLTPPPSNYSGVTINITSPTVNANTGKCACSQPSCADSQILNSNNSYPYGVPENTGMQQVPPAVPQQIQAYPPQYYMNNYNYATPPQNIDAQMAKRPDVSTEMQNTNNPIPQNITEEDNNATSKEIIDNLNQMAEEQRNLEKNGKETKVVSLTNEYIKSLENYLNNPNKEIRLLAAEEILTRFNEDRSRYDDLALNALVNKMLQDPEKIIRTAAMSALSSGLASGNDYTVKLLEDMQKNPEADKTDVVEAADILLKRSTQTETRYVPQPVQQEIPQVQQEQINNAMDQAKPAISMDDKIASLQRGVAQ